MGKYPASRLRGLKQMDVLREGESSQTYRVRAADEVQAWLKGMTAEQRGELLTQMHAATLRGTSGGEESSTISKGIGAAPSLEGVTALRVVSATISQRTRNGLRWPAANYPRTEALLAQGDAIRLHREAGKDKWRTAHGDAIRRDTLLKLMQSGNLKPLT